MLEMDMLFSRNIRFPSLSDKPRNQLKLRQRGNDLLLMKLQITTRPYPVHQTIFSEHTLRPNS